MPNKKISELTAGAALDGTELVEVVQGGENRKTTTQDIADLGETIVDLGTVSSGTITLDLSRKNFMVILTGTVTIDHSNLVAGREYKLWVQRATNTTINWAASKWKAPLGQIPRGTDPTTNGVGTAIDCFSFCSRGVDGRPTIAMVPDIQNI